MYWGGMRRVNLTYITGCATIHHRASVSDTHINEWRTNMSVKIEAIEAPNDAENEGIKHPALTSASFSRNNLRMQVDEFGVRVSYENDGTCTSYRSYFDVQRLLDDHILVSIVELLGDYIYQIPCDGAEQVDAVPDNGA